MSAKPIRGESVPLNLLGVSVEHGHGRPKRPVRTGYLLAGGVIFEDIAAGNLVSSNGRPVFLHGYRSGGLPLMTTLTWQENLLKPKFDPKRYLQSFLRDGHAAGHVSFYRSDLSGLFRKRIAVSACVPREDTRRAALDVLSTLFLMPGNFASFTARDELITRLSVVENRPMRGSFCDVARALYDVIADSNSGVGRSGVPPHTGTPGFLGPGT